GSSPPLLLRQFSIKWWKAIQVGQASKEADTTYHHNLTVKSPPRPPRSPTRVPMTNTEIAKRIQNYDRNEAKLARIINDIRSSPTPSEDIFQDAQDPYDDYKLDD
nr:reverse transcriptase domain, zinc finger, CCHC-type, aspartic peptidase domain protein [Tanacetum cinerariifolium]